MPFLTRDDIAPDVRSDGDQKYKAQIRQALRNPALSPEHRATLRAKLKAVGKPRVYDAESPPPPGALELHPS